MKKGRRRRESKRRRRRRRKSLLQEKNRYPIISVEFFQNARRRLSTRRKSASRCFHSERKRKLSRYAELWPFRFPRDRHTADIVWCSYSRKRSAKVNCVELPLLIQANFPSSFKPGNLQATRLFPTALIYRLLHVLSSTPIVWSIHTVALETGGKYPEASSYIASKIESRDSSATNRPQNGHNEC
jgi:hypothetical protein